MSDPIKLELQMVMSCLTRVLGTKLRILGTQQALLTAEPYLQPYSIILSNNFNNTLNNTEIIRCYQIFTNIYYKKHLHQPIDGSDIWLVRIIQWL